MGNPTVSINPSRVLMKRDRMLYGQFIEHFHRQIYGGVYDSASPFADEDGLRTDVLEAMRRIQVPILRWPGGCFVSSYHWQKAVGPVRTPAFDKAWRVEDPNSFGTNEYVKMCRKIGCEPYICANAGSGTAEDGSKPTARASARSVLRNRYAIFLLAAALFSFAALTLSGSSAAYYAESVLHDVNATAALTNALASASSIRTAIV